MGSTIETAKAAFRGIFAAQAERAVFGLAAALALCAGLGFASLAAWIALAREVDPLGASLVLSGGYVALALLILAVGSLRARRRRRMAALARARLEADALAAAVSAGGALKYAPFAALAAGIFLGGRRR